MRKHNEYNSSYYDKNKHGLIVNAELADTSYKWAGGGFISTVGDLLKFGNVMLYSYQQTDDDKAGYLKKETVCEMWTSVENSVMKWGKNAGLVFTDKFVFTVLSFLYFTFFNETFVHSYGLGWTVVPKTDGAGGVVGSQKFHVGHSGGGVGASSVLIIFPRELNGVQDEKKNKTTPKLPQGIVVAVLVNLENVSSRRLGQDIAEEFYKV